MPTNLFRFNYDLNNSHVFFFFYPLYYESFILQNWKNSPKVEVWGSESLKESFCMLTIWQVLVLSLCLITMGDDWFNVGTGEDISIKDCFIN